MWNGIPVPCSPYILDGLKELAQKDGSVDIDRPLFGSRNSNRYRVIVLFFRISYSSFSNYSCVCFFFLFNTMTPSVSSGGTYE